MKAILQSIFALFLIATTFCSCTMNAGVKKDFPTGLNANNSGLAVDDIYLADESGNRMTDNRILLGSKINLVATGVNYFSETKGKVFPGCTIILTDKANKELLNLPDAFADLDAGISAERAETLQASLNTGEPMVAGETYHLKVRFFDKNKKANEIIAKVDIVMKE